MSTDNPRLAEIRTAVACDIVNLEDAYADRAYLLAEVDRLRAMGGSYTDADIESVPGLSRVAEFRREVKGGKEGTQCYAWRRVK